MSPGFGGYINRHLSRSIAELQQLLAHPSVVAQGVGISECADLVASMLRAREFDTQVIPTAGVPVVVGVRPGRTDRTLLFYNHYDVQPPELLELWDSPRSKG